MNTAHAEVVNGSRLERVMWLLSIPAILGIFSWILVWLHYFVARHFVFRDQVECGLKILFVLMLWIGPFTGIASIVLSWQCSLPGWRRLVCHLVNGIWIIAALFGFALYFFYRGTV
jgi:hypothetical protein